MMQQAFRTPFEIRIVQGVEVTLTLVDESKATFRERDITDGTMPGSTETETTMAAYPRASETTVRALFDDFLG